MNTLSVKMSPTKRVMRNVKKRNTVNPNMLQKDVMTLELEDALLSMNNLDNNRPSNDVRFAVKSFLRNVISQHNTMNISKANTMPASGHRYSQHVGKLNLQLSNPKDVIMEDHEEQDDSDSRRAQASDKREENITKPNAGVPKYVIKHQVTPIASDEETKQNQFKAYGEEAHSLHDIRKSQYNYTNAPPVDKSKITPSKRVTTNQKGDKKLNDMISRLTRQTESSGRK